MSKMLLLKLRENETLMIEGAKVRFLNNCQIGLETRHSFVFGKQFMLASEATKSLREFYFVVQEVYCGSRMDMTYGDYSVPFYSWLDQCVAILGDEKAQRIKNFIYHDELQKLLALLRREIMAEAKTCAPSPDTSTSGPDASRAGTSPTCAATAIQRGGGGFLGE